MGTKLTKEKNEKNNKSKSPINNTTIPTPSFDGGEVDWEVAVDILSNICHAKKLRNNSNMSIIDRDKPELALRGVSLEYLFGWWDNLKKDRSLGLTEVSTTRQVVDYIREYTKESRKSLWANLAPEHRGSPTIAISHSWDYKFQFLIDSLQFNRNRGPAELSGVTYIWLDIVALTQHADGSTKQAEEISQLGDIFGKSIPFVAQILPRSEFYGKNPDLGALTRAWCVFELARACSSGARFTFLVPTDNNTDWHGPSTMTKCWQPHNSRALFQSDKDAIDRLVLDTFKSWNTLKVITFMIFLNLNNSGPVFFGESSQKLVQRMYPWNILFFGSTQNWDKLVEIYQQFYFDRM